MPWITPKAWSVPAPVSNLDLDRIEGNIDYIRNQDATFLGNKTFGNNIIQVAGVTSLKSTSINGTLSVIGSSATSGFLDTTGYVFTLGRLNFDNYINSKGTIVFNTGSNTGLSNSNLILNKDRSSVFTGGSGSIGISSTGYELEFTRSFTNYFNATSVGGNFAFNTNGNTGLTAPNLQLLQSGNNIFGAGTDNGDFIQAGLDLDKSFTFGRCKIGFITGESDRVFLGHIDNFTTGNASINISNLGETTINASAAKFVNIRNNNLQIAQFTGTIINLLKPTTITGDLAISGNINPTTTPTESDTTVLTNNLDFGTIPRGIYSVVLSLAVDNQGTSDEAYLALERRYTGFDWQEISRVVVNVPNTTKDLHIQGLQESTGSSTGVGALRIKLYLSGTNVNPRGYARLLKS